MTSPLEEHLHRLRRSVVIAGIVILALTSGVLIWYTGPPLGAPHDETAGVILRVACPDPQKTANVISPYGPGLERELIATFAGRRALIPSWRVVASREEALELLRNGEVDLAVGFGDDETASAAREDGIRAGASYAYFRPVQVEGLDFPAPGEMDDDDENAASEYPLFSPAMDLLPETGDALFLDPAAFTLWRPLLGDIRIKILNDALPHRWFWKEGGLLDADLTAFWAEDERAAQLDALTERYYGFLPKRPLTADILDLADTVRTRLPTYEDMILKAAEETGVPPLLLTAVIYRESRFNPNAVSATRVYGLMQLTTATADMLGVDRTDPAQSIMGGARYLRSIWDSLENKNLDPWDRWFMTLAAYNQGPGSLNGAMNISRNLGDTGATWAELRKAYPRLRDSRGQEAVTFVDSVRYYYFILHGLVALAPGEMQHLAPFLGVNAP